MNINVTCSIKWDASVICCFLRKESKSLLRSEGFPSGVSRVCAPQTALFKSRFQSWFASTGSPLLQYFIFREKGSIRVDYLKLSSSGQHKRHTCNVCDTFRLAFPLRIMAKCWVILLSKLPKLILLFGCFCICHDLKIWIFK